MAVIDLAKRVLTLHILYFGPRQSGCGTNVRQLHRGQPPQRRVELHHLGSDDRGERIWYFTTPIDEVGDVGGFDVLVQVSSLPSAADVALERDPFFDTLDGVVFVADARAHRHEDNVAALLDLHACLVRRGLDLTAIPMVFQVNQTDHPNARPAARVLEELDAHHTLSIEAMARQGKGVLETWDAIRRLVVGRLAENSVGGQLSQTITALSRAAREADVAAVLGHVATLPQVNRAAPDVVVTGSPVEVVLAPEELIATQPLHVLSCELRAGRVRLELLVRRGDGTTRRAAFVLESRAEGAAPPEEVTQPIHAGALPAVSEPLPQLGAPDVEGDMPGLLYGLIGVAAGFVAGFLVRFIFVG
jgi:hypothetical protein